ncbi:MAG TPA: hypothetical protein VGX70_05215 [Gemmataceae bacterium]|jgi:hypothetical protein|nr:hypothetical protein [Gemmataceae bacterium]
MHPDELLRMVRRQPFVPFRLHVSDGSSYEVRHPEMVLVTRRAAVLAMPDNPTQPAERVVTVAMVHVSRLEELTSAAGGDGAAS